MKKLDFFRTTGILILLTVIFLSGCKPGPSGDQQESAESEQMYVEPENQVAEEPRVIPCTEEDSLALVAFYHATYGDEWVDPWTFDGPVYYWEGITLSEEGRVTGISLPDFNIQGTFPEEMEALTELGRLNLDNNPVYGSILLLNYKDEYSSFHVWHHYNDIEPGFIEDQLNWFTASVYHPNGLDIYSTPEMSDENSVGSFGQGEVAYLLEPLNADPHDPVEIDGYSGTMRPVDLGYDTAWIFSGYLCKLPLPEGQLQSYFYDNLRLIYSLQIEHGYELLGGELIASDEGYSTEDIIKYEHGITVIESSGYYGGGTSIHFDRDFYDIQDVYLFGDVIRDGAFTEKFGRTFPDQPVKDTIKLSEETMEILTVSFDDEGGYLKQISISLEDIGYYEDLSIYVEEEHISLSWGGGD